MSMKPQMIVFGEDWGGLPSSTQHIIRQMADNYRITWINSLGLRSPRATWHDVKRIIDKAVRMLKPNKDRAAKTQKTTEHHQQLLEKVVEPRYLPFPGNPLARRINRRLLTKLLQAQIDDTPSGARPVIWISLPNAVDALYYLKEIGLQNARIIYYCCDDFASLSGVDHKAIVKLEKELMEKADVIVATNPLLLEKMPKNKAFEVPHGVDTALFFNPVERAADLPEGKPIAGFYGSIAQWVDVRLLSAVAKRLPQWNFVFIGTVKTDIRQLSELNNVFFLGPRPHHELPTYSQHWQASMLPFVKSGQIEACNPLKLREYLAAGKPVVATDFPAARDYQEHVCIADDAERFAEALQASLAEKPVMWALRRRRMSGESWQAVARRINGLIEAH